MAMLGFAYGSFGDILETIKLVPKIVELVRGGAHRPREWAETENRTEVPMPTPHTYHHAPTSVVPGRISR
jgi:hypothetical protein